MRYICKLKMNRIVYILLFLPFFSNAQERSVSDTLVKGNDTILLFNDKTWEYSHAIHFNGILNPYLANSAKSSQLTEDWDNEMTFNYDNDLSILEDTIWLCTLDTSHSDFCIPHPGMLTSEFKMRGRRFHYGIDLDLETGDSVKCAFDGIVRYSKYNTSGFGYLVIVRHYNGLETYYAHLSKLFVQPNQKIKAGDVLGLGGKTGRAYGDHLHFEVRFYHNPIDPEEVIDFKNKRVRNDNLFVHKSLFDYRKIDGKKRNYTNANNAIKTEKTENTPREKKYHTVKSGDSLYAMSLKYKTTVDKICNLNGISKKKILRIGEKIRVR